MVELLSNGIWSIKYKEYVIEIDPTDFFTSIYIKEITEGKLSLRLIQTDQTAEHVIDCLFIAFRIIYEYNEGNSTSMQY